MARPTDFAYFIGGSLDNFDLEYMLSIPQLSRKSSKSSSSRGLLAAAAAPIPTLIDFELYRADESIDYSPIPSIRASKSSVWFFPLVTGFVC